MFQRETSVESEKEVESTNYGQLGKGFAILKSDPFGIILFTDFPTHFPKPGEI